MSKGQSIIAFILVLGVAGPSLADNLLLNPGFESGEMSPWEEVWIGDDENPPTHPLWSLSHPDWPEPWGAPEGDYYALTHDAEIAIYQAIEPTPATQITDFSFQNKQMLLFKDDRYYAGLVCRFEDPAGEVPYIQNIIEIPVGEEEWLLYDGLTDLQSLAAMVEEAGPEGPWLIGVGLVGTTSATTTTDAWTLVPEPGGLALLSIGALGLLRRRR